ncbi:PD-(D/E)XK nuclease-like domain-containing protein [Maricaulis sp. MIT060901]|uniref:PD-(D/E)XK nuclease-like domain-containing protein n=1 Tax=Maricaulis sp. MIT060901 TaxID=3096993 RepID=UPI00399B0884
MPNDTTGKVCPDELNIAKIDRPGVYDLPMEFYHGDCCVGPSISSSGLRKIEAFSPAHYFVESYLNPDRAAIDTKALAFGRAAHSLLLGDEPFARSFTLVPFTNWNKNEADGEADGVVIGDWTVTAKRKWKTDQQATRRTLVMPDQMDTIKGMKSALEAHPIVQGGVFQGEVEKSIIWQDEETGVWLKARPDVIPAISVDGLHADDTLADYKTTTDARHRARQRDIIERGYAQQLALCAEGLWHTRRQEIRCFVLVMQEKAPPYAVVPIELSQDLIWRAAQLNRRAIRTFAECVQNNDWPAYDVPSGCIETPDWLHQRLQAEEDAGLLPPAPAWCENLKNMEQAA